MIVRRDISYLQSLADPPPSPRDANGATKGDRNSVGSGLVATTSSTNVRTSRSGSMLGGGGGGAGGGSETGSVIGSDSGSESGSRIGSRVGSESGSGVQSEPCEPPPRSRSGTIGGDADHEQKKDKEKEKSSSEVAAGSPSRL